MAIGSVDNRDSSDLDGFDTSRFVESLLHVQNPRTDHTPLKREAPVLSQGESGFDAGPMGVVTGPLERFNGGRLESGGQGASQQPVSIPA
jgi:hypothetical protein